MTTIRLSAGFLLGVGCLWTFFLAFMFLAIAGIADPPQSWAYFSFYWSAQLAGPAVLIIGALFLLRHNGSRSGAILVWFGCVILTVIVLYTSAVALNRKPLQAPPDYKFCAAILFIALLSDLAGYRVYKAVKSSG